MLLMHRRLVRDNFALVVISVPAPTRGTSEVPDVSWEGYGGLAEEALEGAVASEQRWHM